jgi:hypothetical protein
LKSGEQPGQVAPGSQGLQRTMHFQGRNGLEQGTVAQQATRDGLGGGLPQIEEESGGGSVHIRKSLRIQLTQAG